MSDQRESGAEQGWIMVDVDQNERWTSKVELKFCTDLQNNENLIKIPISAILLNIVMKCSYYW